MRFRFRLPYQRQLDRIEEKLSLVINLVRSTHMTIEEVEAKVDAQTGVINSSNALLGEIAQLIRDNANSPAKLQALADKIDANTGSLSAAVASNSDVDPTP